MTQDGHWTSPYELTTVAATRLLSGEDPNSVLAFLQRHERNLP